MAKSILFVLSLTELHMFSAKMHQLAERANISAALDQSGLYSRVVKQKQLKTNRPLKGLRWKVWWYKIKLYGMGVHLSSKDRKTSQNGRKGEYRSPWTQPAECGMRLEWLLTLQHDHDPKHTARMKLETVNRRLWRLLKKLGCLYGLLKEGLI